LSRVILEKLIVTQLIKKVSDFYGTRRFITVITRALQFRGPVLHFVTSCFLTVVVVSSSHNPHPPPAGRPPLVGCPRPLITRNNS